MFLNLSSGIIQGSSATSLIGTYLPTCYGKTDRGKSVDVVYLEAKGFFYYPFLLCILICHFAVMRTFGSSKGYGFGSSKSHGFVIGIQILKMIRIRILKMLRIRDTDSDPQNDGFGIPVPGLILKVIRSRIRSTGGSLHRVYLCGLGWRAVLCAW